MWLLVPTYKQQASALRNLRHKKKEPEIKFRTDQSPEELAELEATLREIEERKNNTYKFSYR